MKARSIGALIVGLVGVLALNGSPAGAGTALGPEIVDQAGDANFLNRNGGGVRSGTTEIPPDFSVVTPAEIDGADLRAIWFETDYSTVKDTDEFGNVVAVRNVANALLVKIKTEAPPRPTFGPTLIFRVPVSFAPRCEAWLEGQVLGAASVPGDVERAQIRKISTTTNPCPGGSATLTSGFTLSSQGNVLTLRYPFSALPYSSTQLVLAEDVVIKQPLFAAVQPHVTVLTPSAYLIGTAQFGAPIIDQTTGLATKFRIGSDVPEDVDCLVTPAPAECTA